MFKIEQTDPVVEGAYGRDLNAALLKALDLAHEQAGSDKDIRFKVLEIAGEHSANNARFRMRIQFNSVDRQGR